MKRCLVIWMLAIGLTALMAPAGAIAAAPAASQGQDGLSIEYSTPKRFGKIGKNGIAKYPTRKQIAPRAWRANFLVRKADGTKCRSSDVLTASASGAAGVRLVTRGRDACRFYGLFAEEGRYEITVSLRSDDAAGRRTRRASRSIVIQDWLIFGLGDSNGSGEGAPDAPSRLLGLTPARWQSAPCNRSANSYQAQAARAIERGDRRTSVTFVHRACSGASISSGLLGRFRAINGRKTYAGQIASMRSLAQGREIDAVVISIGANDIGFSSAITHCIEHTNCPNSRFPASQSGTTLAEHVDQRVKALPGLYARLALALRQARIPPERVIITEYFDPTRNEQGKTCDPLLATPFGAIDRTEAHWASTRFVSPLNAAVGAAAERHGWRLVAGVDEGFRTHGYCSSDPWIVGLTESLTRQGNVYGTLHSTTRGNAFQAGLLASKLREDLYRSGQIRRPVGSFQPSGGFR